MLIRNIFTQDGLVNGAIGTVAQLEINMNKVVAIHVLFDDPTIGRMTTKSNIHSKIPIYKIKHTFHFQSRSIVRETFPIVLCWARSIHKVQGMTFNTITIDIGTSVFQSGMPYVALSRVKSSTGLRIIALNLDKIGPREDVFEEYNRLDSDAHI